jgi:hypothetical protein
MNTDPEKSLSDEATFAGHQMPQRADVSLGDERTLGDASSGQDTIIDDIEVVDLEARYRIDGTLGQGGMGAVLLATDTRLDRKVAIKRILGEAAGNRMAVNRFLTEAKSIAALNHPNIVQIYDYGRAKDGPFLIMEFVDGGSLLDSCRDGAMPLEAAVALACQLCDGLAKAHDLGIIHRDIKPANVLLTKDGTPKLTDFGLAKAQTGDHGQTMTGAVLGTPDFMSPEQRRDAALVDHRSDLWSLAATVYQMVTGRSPKIIRFDLLPAELTKVLGKALEDAKDHRYQTVREFRDALKVSLRAAAPQPFATVEGQCPSCGVQNDSSRRFCRGCGGSLEAPCLSCEKPMPIGEEICGSCGSKQTPLLESRRAAMAAEQVKAEGLLGDAAFDQAAQIATRLRDEAHPRLSQLKSWAERFLEELAKARSHQTERVAESLAEAAEHEAAHDYLSAIFAIHSIPDAMQTVVLPGAREPVAAVLARLKQKQAESRRLEALVKERIAAKSTDGLLPEVDKLLALQPEREDLKKLRQQLVTRQQKLETARDEAIATARALLARHDDDGAVAALAHVQSAAMSQEVSRLRTEAEKRIERARTLGNEIRAAVAGKQLDGLLPSIEAYLSVKPGDEEMARLRQSLIARDEKIAAGFTARITQARKLQKACRFRDAVAAIEQIPESKLPADVSDLVRACRLLEEAKLATQSAYSASLQSLDYDAFVSNATRYQALLAAHSLQDDELTDKIPECRRKMQRREAAQDAAAAFTRALKVSKKIGTIVVATGATIVGVFLFSREKFDGADALFFQWLPILLMLGVWVAIFRNLDRWYDD